MKQAWPETLTVEVREFHGYPCIQLRGEGEKNGAQYLFRTIQALLNSGKNQVLLDTREVLYLDPHCAGAIQDAITKLEDDGGMLVMIDQSLPVERSLKLLGLDRFAHVEPSISQACRRFK